MKKIITLLLSVVFVVPAFAQNSLEEFFAVNGSPNTPPSDPSGAVQVPAGGAGTFINTRAEFDGLFAMQTCEDFEASGDLGLNAFPAPLDENTNDGGYMPGDIIPGAIFQDNPINDSDGMGGSPTGIINLGSSAGFGNGSVVLITNTFVDSMDILVTDPTVTAFGSDFVSFVAAVPVDISVFDTSDVLINSFTGFPATNAEGSFLGFDTGGIPIGRINIEDPAGGAVEGVDNFCLAQAGVNLPPPPAVPALNGTGLTIMVLLLLLGAAVTVRRFS